MKKVLFAVNVTDDKLNDQEDGIEFIKDTVDFVMEKEIGEITEDILDNQKRAGVSSYLSVLKIIAMMGAAIIGGGLISAMVDTPFEEIYDNAAILFYIFPILVVLWILVHMIEKSKFKKVANDPYTESINQKLEDTLIASRAQLGVPDDAIEMDFMSFRYKIKGEDIKEINTGVSKHFLLVRATFVKDGYLYMADMNTLYGVRLEDIVKVEKIDKKMMSSTWNKDELPTKGIFKPYKMTTNDMGVIIAKSYYVVSIKADGEGYLLYIPMYEIEKFLELTGLETTSI